jgi:hypothetical protein
MLTPMERVHLRGEMRGDAFKIKKHANLLSQAIVQLHDTETAVQIETLITQLQAMQAKLTQIKSDS